MAKFPIVFILFSAGDLTQACYVEASWVVGLATLICWLTQKIIRTEKTIEKGLKS